MAWFWSPKQKRKFEIIGYKESWNFAELKGVKEKDYKKMNGYSKEYKVYYRDENGNAEFTRVTNSDNPVYKGLKQYFKENKINSYKTYKHYDKSKWHFYDL